MILVTGAAGTIGGRLTRALRARGHRVRALVLPGDPLRGRLADAGCELVEGDITVPPSLGRALEGVDTVLHLAAVLLTDDPSDYERVNAEGTRNLLEASAKAKARHFVHVSSASVVYPKTTPYSRSKRRAEEWVRGQTDLAWTIVRPTLVYGEGGGAELLLLWDYLLRFPWLLPFVGDGRAKKRPVHVNDLVRGMVAIPGNEKTHGKIYNLSGGETITIEELAMLLLRQSGRSPRVLHLPAPACELGAWVLSKLMRHPPLTLGAVRGVTQDADLDPWASARDLGYSPMGVTEGLPRCFPRGRPA
ncbi:MAG: NAD-dependent epimerase/dehydratase family protein [Myxococcales bacterium]|nr:NAD-dependent epimerase/dehydratase family protein [Myxococcales bacterium]